ncbi:hypothetical protein [Catellatospora vulcania]|uniref:hypothetical protein n=1 Tax=Catellatospora vulcania TaxID=1460450 RepID=UPI0012D46375|nr:hypothetical protein [Catellatospora vulcania]
MRPFKLLTIVVLALPALTACGDQATPTSIPSKSPSAIPSPSPSLDPAAALRKQTATSTLQVCEAYYTYRTYLLDPTALAALQSAKRDPVKGRQAIARWKKLLTDFQSALKNQIRQAQHPQLKEALTEESKVVAWLLAEVSKLRSDGAAAWNLVVTEEYRSIGNKILVTCNDLR